MTACATVSACAPRSQHVQAAVASPGETSATADARQDGSVAQPAPSGPRPYPPSYPRVDEAELARREAAAAKRNAGWDVTLDAVGLLASAERPAFASGDAITGAERKAVDDLLANNQDLVGGDVHALATLQSAGPSSSLLWQELVDGVVVGWVRADKLRGKLRVEGHLWPGLDVREDVELVGEEAARQALAAVDAIADAEHAPLKRGVRVTAVSSAGPFEVHLCVAFDRGTSLSVSVRSAGVAPNRPCVDAITGALVLRGATFRTTTTTRAGRRETAHHVEVY